MGRRGMTVRHVGNVSPQGAGVDFLEFRVLTLVDKRETKIRRMFGNIAPSYDLLNHLLSMNIDHFWRWRTTKLVPPRGDGPILDLCTGTGDLALAYHRAGHGELRIVGADFCHEMLVRARGKVQERRAAERI